MTELEKLKRCLAECEVSIGVMAGTLGSYQLRVGELGQHRDTEIEKRHRVEIGAAEAWALIRCVASRCAEIARAHADRAPGELIPVGAGAKACDQIIKEFDLEGDARVSSPLELGGRDR